MRDIGRALGVSHSTVSLALRDSPLITEGQRAQVRAMAEKLGYFPDPMLGSLAAYRLGKGNRPAEIRSCIGWINQWNKPEELRGYREFDEYWKGASEMAQTLGYRLEEFAWPKEQSGSRLQAILQTRGVRGLLLPPQRDGFHLSDFDWGQFSVVRFGESVTWPRVHTVSSDQGNCARLAYEKARELGYQRIGYVSDARYEMGTRGHFREGYLSAQEDLAPPDRHIEVLLLSRDRARDEQSFLAWVKRHRPDAVITTDPSLRELLKASGIRIPQDLAVAATSVLDCGFDSGADQNSHEIGRVAMITLASLILSNERGVPTYQRRILVEGRWVQGQSMIPLTTRAEVHPAVATGADIGPAMRKEKRHRLKA